MAHDAAPRSVRPDSHPERSAGEMTSVMRAHRAPHATKVLRVGVVHGGRVIEERILTKRRPVTVGASENCTFVVAGAPLPAGFRLFEPRGDRYALRFTDAMTGRVALASGIVDLVAARGHARRVESRDGTTYELLLGPEARGKVIIADATFLFQHVPAPQAVPRAQLPTAVRTSLADDVDWATAMIAAFSFLLHFGLVGSIYSDWMDPTVDDEVNVAQLLESVRQLPTPPPIEEPQLEASTQATAAPAAAQPERGPSGSRTPGQGSAGAKAPGDLRAAEIANEMSKLDLAVLTALSSGRSATDNAIGMGDVPTGLLDRAAGDAAGASGRGASGLDLGGRGGGRITPGSRRGLEDIGNREAAAPSTIGSAAAPKKPIGNSNVSPPIMDSACDVPNASGIVAGMRGRFRTCYEKLGLGVDPAMKGSVRIVTRIGPNGEVTSASPTGASGLSSEVTTCVANRVASAQFEPPACGGATIVIPVSFYPQPQ